MLPGTTQLESHGDSIKQMQNNNVNFKYTLNYESFANILVSKPFEGQGCIPLLNWLLTLYMFCYLGPCDEVLLFALEQRLFCTQGWSIHTTLL